MKKLSITTFLFLSLPFFLLSNVSAEGIWFPTDKPNCQVWNPNPSSEETASWSGACLSGKAHGKGSTTWRWKEDGKFVLRLIEGEMTYGRRLGQVKITYENGDLYVGNLDKNGNRVEGQGTYTSAVSETESISCKNFEGVSVDYSKGKPDLSRDGYSGLTITLEIDDTGKTIAIYSGSTQRTDEVDVESANDDFISWSKYFNDVHKIYTLYINPSVMSLVEIQTQLLSGMPQVRVYMGTCG